MTTATSSSSICTLDIGGMTCASCVRHVEKALSRIDGVRSAEVNLATEAATVSFDPQTAGLSELTAAVAAAGYTATPRHAAGPQPAPRDDQDAATTAEVAHDAQLRDLKRKWQVTLAAGLGLMALMYLPLNLDTMDWLMPAIFVVATVLQFWAGRGLYAAAWAAARHGTTNMNTLVALGTAVAWGYSAFITLWPGIAERAGLPLHLYFETSLVVIALILMGRWMELRAKKRTAAAIAELVGLAPKTARVIRDGRGISQPLPCIFASQCDIIEHMLGIAKAIEVSTPVLTSADLAQFVDRLRTVDLNASDPELIDQITELERIKSACAAAQAALTLAFVTSQTEGLTATQQRETRAHRSISAQVAHARHDSPARGGRHVGAAKALLREMPHTYRSLQTGEISEYRATLIIRETACLDVEHRRMVDQELAGTLGAMGDRQTANTAAKIAYRLDPASCVERNRKAHDDRRVTIRPAPTP